MATAPLRAQVAPPNFANVVFNGSIGSGTGGAASSGDFSLLFTGAGMDHTLSTTGAPVSDPVPYVYEKTGANTATIFEQFAGGRLAVALTFSTETSGTFRADYGEGQTQTGTFTYARVPAPAPLFNMSNRAFVPAGGMTIAGLVVGGVVPRRVLMRAVGPGLADFGVADPLADPRVTIYRGSEAMTGEANSFEDDADTVAAASAQAGAFALRRDSADAAVVATLGPGAYTLVVRGGDAQDSGEVLIETYLLE